MAIIDDIEIKQQWDPEGEQGGYTCEVVTPETGEHRPVDMQIGGEITIRNKFGVSANREKVREIRELYQKAIAAAGAKPLSDLVTLGQMEESEVAYYAGVDPASGPDAVSVDMEACDADGNPCIRIFGPEYSIDLSKEDRPKNPCGEIELGLLPETRYWYRPGVGLVPQLAAPYGAVSSERKADGED